MTHALLTEGLCFERRGRRLLGPCDLRLGASGICGVAGANGAGKSLLLRLLHGLLAPSAGRVCWQPDGAGPRQTLVPQRPVMLRRSVLDNLRVVPVPAVAGVDHALDALRWAGIEHLAARRADQLSPGLQQMVAIARCRLCRPEWLFLDEPTASLDPAATERVEAMLRRLVEDGVRIVFCSHDVAQLGRLADEVLFLDAGQPDYYPRLQAFLDAPRGAAAADFLRLGLLRR